MAVEQERGGTVGYRGHGSGTGERGTVGYRGHGSGTGERGYSRV